MRTNRAPVLAVLLAAMASGGAFTGCEVILPWPGDGGDGSDAGDGGREDGGDGGDGGANMGDGGSGAWLSSFGPDASYVRVPANGGLTYPGALVVSILRGGESGAVRVDITSSDASVARVAGDFLDIPAGSTSAQVPIVSSAVGSATLTASFDGGSIPARVTALPTVLISEVAAEGSLNSNDEFVELYNPTPVEFSLAGHALQYHSNNGSSPYLEIVVLDGGARIAPHSYFLVGVNTFGTNPVPDARSTWTSGAFSNSAGTVRLGAPGVGTAYDAGYSDPLVLDTLGWGTSSVSYETAPMPLPLAFLWGSLERKAHAGATASSMSSGADSNGGNAHDSDDNSADFVARGSRDPQNSSSPAEPPP